MSDPFRGDQDRMKLKYEFTMKDGKVVESMYEMTDGRVHVDEWIEWDGGMMHRESLESMTDPDWETNRYSQSDLERLTKPDGVGE